MGVPVIGCHCTVCRSPDPRNKRTRCSVWIETDRASLLIDCSPELRQQALQAAMERLDGVMLTHIHKDHSGGMDDLRAFFRPDHSLPVLTYAPTGEQLMQSFSYLFDPAMRNPPRLAIVPVHEPRGTISFCGEEVSWILYHQREIPVLGYRIGRFAYTTDIRVLPAHFHDWLNGVSVLVLSALQLETHDSFLSVDEAVALAETLPVEQVVLTHMSHLVDTTTYLLPPNVSFGYDHRVFVV